MAKPRNARLELIRQTVDGCRQRRHLGIHAKPSQQLAEYGVRLILLEVREIPSPVIDGRIPILHPGTVHLRKQIIVNFVENLHRSVDLRPIHVRVFLLQRDHDLVPLVQRLSVQPFLAVNLPVSAPVCSHLRQPCNVVPRLAQNLYRCRFAHRVAFCHLLRQLQFVHPLVVRILCAGQVCLRNVYPVNVGFYRILGSLVPEYIFNVSLHGVGAVGKPRALVADLGQIVDVTQGSIRRFVPLLLFAGIVPTKGLVHHFYLCLLFKHRDNALSVRPAHLARLQLAPQKTVDHCLVIPRKQPTRRNAVGFPLKLLFLFCNLKNVCGIGGNVCYLFLGALLILGISANSLGGHNCLFHCCLKLNLCSFPRNIIPDCI